VWTAPQANSKASLEAKGARRVKKARQTTIGAESKLVSPAKLAGIRMNEANMLAKCAYLENTAYGIFAVPA
jgi:hypothetical protein